jgi:hypothetical protein
MAESKSADNLSRIKAHSEFSRSVHPLKALGDSGCSEWGQVRRGVETRRIAPGHRYALGSGFARLPALAIGV